MDFEKLSETMRDAALRAGDEIMDVYGTEDFEVQTKGDDSPVTAADQRADALILAALTEAFPDVLVVTEEQARTHTQSAASFLIVDPLDGTKEFIKRRGEFTVNIAYVENGHPVRGIVYAPAKGRLFYTRADGSVVSGPSLSSLVAEVDADLDMELRGKLDATMFEMIELKLAAEKGFAYDMMLERGNEAGEALIMGAVDALVDQTRSIERVVAVLGVDAIEFEGSDSLDNPDAVFE